MGSLMPLLTNSRMSKYKASQLLNFSQLEKELKWSTTKAAELSTISSNSSSQKLLRRPLMLVKTSSKYSQLSTWSNKKFFRWSTVQKRKESIVEILISVKYFIPTSAQMSLLDKNRLFDSFFRWFLQYLPV